MAGERERAPGGTVDVTAIALATEGVVVKETVEDGTAATTAAAAAAAAAAATAVAFREAEVEECAEAPRLCANACE